MADEDALQAEEKIIESSIASHAAEISLDQPYPEELGKASVPVAPAPVPDAPDPATPADKPAEPTPAPEATPATEVAATTEAVATPAPAPAVAPVVVKAPKKAGFLSRLFKRKKKPAVPAAPVPTPEVAATEAPAQDVSTEAKK